MHGLPIVDARAMDDVHDLLLARVHEHIGILCKQIGNDGSKIARPYDSYRLHRFRVFEVIRHTYPDRSH